jgi:hypothetical protein
MIFETLAAMADYVDDKKFNYSSDAAGAKTVLTDAKNTGAKTVIDGFTASGVLTVTSETLTIGGVERTNDPLNHLNQHITGIQDKTPRATVEGNFEDIVYTR